MRSPFTNGAILADEVGLGKTVEAGIVLSQKWAERRRRILIVVPAMLRKQWQQDLSEKFFIPSEVLDTQFFDEELQKLDRWSEDLKLSLEHEIKELDKQIRELRRSAVLAQSLQDKLTHQKQLRDLERRRNGKRRELFDAQGAIDQQREDLIGKIEKQLKHTNEVRTLFTIRWRVA